jgi:hypothetical protein
MSDGARGDAMLEMEPQRPRRSRLLDVILLVAATAAALLPTKDRWTEVAPVARQLDITRFFDPEYVNTLFQGQMRSRRADSIRLQFEHLVGPATGPWGIIAWQNAMWKGNADALEYWVLTHAPPGALGFALAQDLYYLVFPFLILWSFCIVVLRLLRPRPAWFDLFRQPGWWACFGSILAAVLGMTLQDNFGIPVPSLIACIRSGGVGRTRREPKMEGRAVVDRPAGAASGRAVDRDDSGVSHRLCLFVAGGIAMAGEMAVSRHCSKMAV